MTKDEIDDIVLFSKPYKEGGMFRISIITVISIALLTTPVVTFAQNSWSAKDGAVKNTDLKGVISGSDTLYIATKSSLYRAKDIKEKWESIFSLPQGGSNEINCIAGRSKMIFIGTKRGLFKSEDYGRTWKNIFRTILPDRNNIVYIELSRHDKNKLIIATGKGIFISYDLGGKWEDISGVLKNTAIRCLAMNKESMYAGAESGLYVRRLQSNDWERLVVRIAAEKSEAEEIETIAESEAEEDGSIRCIAINNGRVYAGYRKTIIYSDDAGKNWADFSSGGLNGAINYLLISAKNKKLYCATDKGVFEYSEEKSKWFELYKGLSKSLNVERLIFSSDDERSLLAATDKGLFGFEASDYMIDKYPDIDKSMKTLKVTFDGEPTFKELQQAAIKHCDVSPDKVRNWHSQSRLKALIPRVSVGMGSDRSSNTEIYTSATKDYAIQGPEDYSSNLDFSVSWDLGNLIWSDDQTNIDVRSRLTVQLRNDVLDDLRRAYYERKRVQLELVTNPPKDANARLEKELRIQELTQAIDDLTGNYLSEHMRKSS